MPPKIKFFEKCKNFLLTLKQRFSGNQETIDVPQVDIPSWARHDDLPWITPLTRKQILKSQSIQELLKKKIITKQQTRNIYLHLLTCLEDPTILEQVLAETLDYRLAYAPILQEYVNNRSLTIKQAMEITPNQAKILESESIRALLKAEIISIKQAIALRSYQQIMLEREGIAARIIAKTLDYRLAMGGCVYLKPPPGIAIIIDALDWDMLTAEEAARMFYEETKWFEYICGLPIKFTSRDSTDIKSVSNVTSVSEDKKDNNIKDPFVAYDYPVESIARLIYFGIFQDGDKLILQYDIDSILNNIISIKPHFLKKQTNTSLEDNKIFISQEKNNTYTLELCDHIVYTEKNVVAAINKIKKSLQSSPEASREFFQEILLHIYFNYFDNDQNNEHNHLLAIKEILKILSVKNDPGNLKRDTQYLIFGYPKFEQSAPSVMMTIRDELKKEIPLAPKQQPSDAAAPHASVRKKHTR